MFGEGKYYSVIVMNSLKNITGKSMELVSSDHYPFLMSIFILLNLAELSSNFITDKTCSLKTFSNNNLL